MSALPYMPLYVADYLADTAHLSALENGAYLLLIMNYWQRGNPLPSGDVQLARIARVSNEEWQTIRPSLAEFFFEDDGLWRHNRIDAELEKVRDKSAKASKAGKASAQRPSNRRSTDVQRTFNHTDTDTDTDTELNNKQSSTGLAPATALDWTDLEAKLRKAAGWENEPHPGLCVIGPIVGLIEGGASLDLDILPVITSRAAKLKAKSWAYFVGPIQDAMAARQDARLPPSRASPDGEARRKNAAAELQRLSEETGWKPGTKATASTPVIS